MWKTNTKKTSIIFIYKNYRKSVYNLKLIVSLSALLVILYFSPRNSLCKMKLIECHFVFPGLTLFSFNDLMKKNIPIICPSKIKFY